MGEVASGWGNSFRPDDRPLHGHLLRRLPGASRPGLAEAWLAEGEAAWRRKEHRELFDNRNRPRCDLLGAGRGRARPRRPPFDPRRPPGLRPGRAGTGSLSDRPPGRPPRLRTIDP